MLFGPKASVELEQALHHLGRQAGGPQGRLPGLVLERQVQLIQGLVEQAVNFIDLACLAVDLRVVHAETALTVELLVHEVNLGFEALQCGQERLADGITREITLDLLEEGIARLQRSAPGGAPARSPLGQKGPQGLLQILPGGQPFVTELLELIEDLQRSIGRFERVLQLREELLGPTGEAAGRNLEELGVALVHGPLEQPHGPVVLADQMGLLELGGHFQALVPGKESGDGALELGLGHGLLTEPVHSPDQPLHGGQTREDSWMTERRPLVKQLFQGAGIGLEPKIGSLQQGWRDLREMLAQTGQLHAESVQLGLALVGNVTVHGCLKPGLQGLLVSGQGVAKRLEL